MMPEAKKPKVESAGSFPSAENDSEDDDDDLFISFWDDKSTTSTSSTGANTTKSKPKSLPNSTSSASGFTNNRPNDGIDNKNGILISVNNPSSRVSSRNIQDHKSSTSKDLRTSRNVYGQASRLGRGSQNSSCSATNNMDKQSSSGFTPRDLTNKDSNGKNGLNLIAIDGDHTSSSRVDSNRLLDIKNEPKSTPSDWDKPSCSGIILRDFDFYEDSSLETNVCRLKIMFPSLDKDVLKSYVTSYQDFEECVRVISTFMFDGDDDGFICEEIKPTSGSVKTGKTNQNINCLNTIDLQEKKLLPSNEKNYTSVADSSGEKGHEDHDKIKIVAVKSGRSLGDHNKMKIKTLLSSNSRGMFSDLASSSSLRTTRRPPSSEEKQDQNPSSKESSLNVTTTNVTNQSKSQKSDAKYNQTGSKPHTNSLPSSNVVRVGIDIRFGKKKVHHSMKRCLDRSASNRDIAQPYRRNTDTKPSPSDAHITNSCSSAAAKRPLENSSGPSSSKRVYKHSSSPTSSNSHTISGYAATTSRNSFTYSVSNSNSPTSQSKKAYGQGSTHSASTTSRYTIARFSSSLVSASTSRNSSDNSAARSPFKVTFGQTLKHESRLNSSTSDDCVAPSTSRSTSEDSTANVENRSQPSSDLSSVRNQIIDVNKRMLGSQGSLVSNQSTAGMPSKKGKGPNSSTLEFNGCSDPSQQEGLSAEEEVARQEMLHLQRDTEMLAKVCPDSDPNYIFSRLEELKDKPNRVAMVNRELITSASTPQPEDELNVIQEQKKIVWYWEDKKMRRIPFSRAESNIVESEYRKYNGILVRVKFTPETLVLWFNFDSMTLQETLGGNLRHVYRTESTEESTSGKSEDDKRQETGLCLPPLSNPETWHGHSSSTNNTNTALSRELFEVLPGTSEFAHVAGLLKKSLLQAEIKKIKRVKNDWLERKYGIQRGLLREKNGPGGINEMELFHGTRQTPPSVVWNSEEGFDMRYSAHGMWGRGCYFAVHAAYSHNQFTFQYFHKQKRYYQIFLAHVLTGESISMPPDRSIKKPPLNVATGRHYDSVKGITQGHRIYVLYKNEASFPAYLITYSM